MSSEETAVNLKGTFAVKTRSNNGLNRVAAYLNENRMARVPIVGYVEFQKIVETTDGDTMTVDLVAVEPALAADGTDVKGWGRQTFRTLDEIRVAHGKGRVADTLFVTGEAPELDGQLEAISRGDVDGPAPAAGGMPSAESTAAAEEVFGGERNASGDPVPPATGEEIMAERAEALSAVAGGVEAAQQQADSMMEKADGAQKRTPRGERKRPAAAADPFKADQ